MSLDGSWSWDGSIISLPSTHSLSSSSTPSPPSRSRHPSTRSLTASADDDALRGPPAAAIMTPEPLSPSSSAVGEGRSRLPTSSADSPSHAIDNLYKAPTPPPPAYNPREHTHAHALALHLLHDHPRSSLASPPSSPTPSSSSSFPDPRSRLPSVEATRMTGRGRGRTGSVSSTASTDGSAHEGGGESLASGVSSAGEDDHHHAQGLVMPSLHLGGASHSLRREEKPACQEDKATLAKKREPVKVLVLGKTADERRTLATLLSLDDDLRAATSSSSVADLGYSFLSTRPSEPSSDSNAPPQNAPPTARSGIFQPLQPATPSSVSSHPAFVSLFHPVETADTDPSRLSAELLQPLEQLEAKLNRGYPTTDGLLDLVEKAGCGEFEAALFLFSSPPTATEIALARPLSNLIPLLPVLILPPSPTGKPQKTAALEQAVCEQFGTAGVRWVGGLSVAEKEKERNAGKSRSLYLLPHDLFVHNPPSFPSSASGDARHRSGGPSSAASSAPPSAPLSGGSTQASSPASEEPPSTSSAPRTGPTSLTASQELPPAPPSPAFTAASGFSSFASSSAFSAHSSSGASSSSRSPSLASSRRSSSRHRAHHSSHSRTKDRLDSQQYSNSLASLRALQALVHSPLAGVALRKERARQFLEWREVEVAARGFGAQAEVEEKARGWGEKALEAEGGQGGGRRDLDFSRKAAERKAALRAAQEERTPQAASGERDDGDVLASTDDEADAEDPDEHDEHDEHDDLGGASFRRDGTARNSFSGFSASSMDPTTPRVSHRPLAGLAAFSRGSEADEEEASASGSGYFPRYREPSSPSASSQGFFSAPPPSSEDPLVASTSSLSSASSAPSSSHGGLSASSVLLFPLASTTDPFHLPSLLHLVGLNLRLGLFSLSPAPPSSASSADSDAELKPRRSGQSSKSNSAGGWGTFVRAATLVGLVFAAGVVVGASVSSSSSSSGMEAQPLPASAWVTLGAAAKAAGAAQRGKWW
ncbi:hypothetical protein JCM8097_007958 [Rhodosporidiobolus ruineniae]